MGKKVEMIGKRFGRLLVISEDKRDSSGTIHYKCLCDCGNEKIIKGYSLRCGLTQSCGCYHLECVSKDNPIYKRRLYRTYWSMRNRCEYPGSKYYYCYGGRGIRVCEEWKDFETFEKWAYENGFKEGLTLDRIDVNGNYEPSNCRWITQKEQCYNTRRNIYITANGERKTVTEWSQITGIKKATIERRIKLNWKEEDLLKPVDKSYSHGKEIKESWNKRKVIASHDGSRVYIDKDKPRTEIEISEVMNESD